MTSFSHICSLQSKKILRNESVVLVVSKSSSSSWLVPVCTLMQIKEKQAPKEASEQFNVAAK
jgi:hypothetical protein